METARKIVGALIGAGNQAYIVGGAVRDMLRNVAPADIDIVTSAVPDAIINIATRNGWKTTGVGAAFGVVIVMADSHQYEVATFRTERYGADCHRPEAVEFAYSLSVDLARRDFTINALAMDIDGGVVDLFGGREDLQAGIIRTVGNPHARFAEDGLRMFRAARFAARFGFAVDSATLAAIPSNVGRIYGLSVERVRGEIEKTLLADHAGSGLDIMLKAGLLSANCQVKDKGTVTSVPILPELVHLDGLPQNPRYHRYDAWRHTLAAVDLVPRELTLRWAALLHDVAKGWPGVRSENKLGQPSDHGHDQVGASMAAVIMDRLRVARPMAARVVWLISRHMSFPAGQYTAVLRWLKRLAADFRAVADFNAAVEQLLWLHEADRLAGHASPDSEVVHTVRDLADVIRQEMPLFSTQLAISGQDLAAKLGSGPEIGQFQRNLLDRIQAGQLVNTKEALTAALNARRRRFGKKE